MSGWVAAVFLGLVLGWFFRFALVHTYLTASVTAMEAGMVSVDPTMVDDGIGIYYVFVTGVWALLLLVAVPLTGLARRWAQIPARAWWWTSVSLWLLPFLVLDLPSLLG